MNESSSGGSSSAQQLAQRIPNSVGVPIQVLVFAGAAVLAVLVGTVSVGAGFALFVLGLLALVILDQMVSGQQGGQPAGTDPGTSEGGYFSNAARKEEEDDPKSDFEKQQS